MRTATKMAIKSAIVALCLQIVLVSCQDEYFGNFDFGLDNPLTSIWNANGNRNTLVPDTRTPCTVGGTAVGNQDGTCLNSAACRFQRGKAAGRGSCSIWNTCCVFEKTANQTSDARVTYFVSTKGARQLPQAQRAYIRLANKNICQMRVDIVSMTLENPDEMTDPMPGVCTKDYLRVSPGSRLTPIPDICGINKNTHFYVHLDQNQIINDGLILSVLLKTDSQLEPEWNIKVTQLECPGTRRILDLHQHKDNRNQVVQDFNLLAPPRCLQYFTERTGTFTNFGYSSDTASKVSIGQDYAVCFKPIEGSCGVTLTSSFLKLTTDATMPCMMNYIYVPEDGPKCHHASTAPPPPPYESKHPGPLYVHVSVKTALTTATNTEPFGFKITYNNNVACP